MAKQGSLDAFSTEKLVEELKRRISQAEAAKVALASLTDQETQQVKNPKVSAAKTEYWRRRREWLAANPDKTVEDFRRLSRQVVTFDTSVHNRLMNIGESAAPIYSAIKSRYFFRLAGLAYEELMSTPRTADRLALLDGCRKLTTGRGWDCLNPPHEILRILIAAHARDPQSFRWLEVDVRSGGLQYELRNGELTADDALAAQQRSEQENSIKAYKTSWVNLRSKLDPLFGGDNGLARPKSFAEAFGHASHSLLPSIAKGFYDAGLHFDATLSGETITPDTAQETVQQFVDNCPPFRTMLHAVLMSWYNTSLKGMTSEKFAAGRNDLFMATYLPYCDIFVTRDAEQVKCLRELVKYQDVRPEILSFEEFTANL